MSSVTVKRGYAGLLSDIYNGLLEETYDKKYLMFFSINLRKVLNNKFFSSDDIKILNLRYGLDGKDPMPFNEIGRQLGYSEWSVQRRVKKLQQSLRANHTMEILLGKKKDDLDKDDDEKESV